MPDVATAAGDRYDLGAEIARGGMGAVHAAHDRALDRDVAVKVLLDKHDADSPHARRFFAEARIAGRLQHPGIPPIHDVGVLPDGRPFIAMKLIAGRTLQELLAERSSPSADLPRFLAVFEQVCHAVGYAHSRGVVHRDLKPANVMVGEFAEVQVMDWGLAKILGGPTAAGSTALLPAAAEGSDEFTVDWGTADSVDSTKAGSILGTPAFLAPEQARGEVHRLGPRTDVFGLGGILCVILTGKPPFGGMGLQGAVAKAAAGDLAAVFERLDACGADAALVAIAKRCLAPKEEDRPVDGAAAAALVTAYQAGVQERLRLAAAERVAADTRLVEDRKRRRLRGALAAAVVVLLAVGGFGMWWGDRVDERRKSDQRRQDADQRAGATAALDAAVVALKKEPVPIAEVDAALELARQRLGDAAPADLRDRAASLRQDRDMAVALDRLLEGVWSDIGANEPHERQFHAGEYAARFREYGIDLAVDPSAIASRVSGSPLRDRLVDGLDEWWVMTRDRPDARLRGVLRLVDPDVDRDRIRDAFPTGDRRAASAAVRTTDPDRLSAVLAAHARVHLDQHVWGDRALRGRENSFPVLISYSINVDQSEESVLVTSRKYLQAALAAKPNSPYAHVRQATEKRSEGRADEAERHALTAIELAADWPKGHLALAELRAWQGRHEEAVRSYRESIALSPASATDVPYDRLAQALRRWHRDRPEGRDAYAAAVDPRHVSPRQQVLIANGWAALDDRPRQEAALRAGLAAADGFPDRVDASAELTRFLADRGRYEEALAVVGELRPTTLEERLVVAGRRDVLHRRFDRRDRGNAEYAALLAEQATDADRAKVWAAKGTRAHGPDRGPDDLAALRKAVELDPTAVSVRRFLAADLARIGLGDEAVGHYREAAKGTVVDAADAGLALGSLLFNMGRPEEAVAAFAAAGGTDAFDHDAESAYARALVAVGRVDEGERMLAGLERRMGYEHASVIAGLGEAALARHLRQAGAEAAHSLAEAEGKFRYALRLVPGAPFSRYGLAEVLARQGNRGAAIAECRTGLKTDGYPAVGRARLGRLLLEDDQVDAGLAELQAAIDLAPARWEPHTWLGLHHQRRGDIEKAVASFETAIAKQPDRLPNHLDLVNLHRGRRDWAKAADAYRRTIAAFPGELTLRRDLGAMLWNDAKQLPEALAVFREWQKAAPHDPNPPNDIGCVLRDLGKTEDAVAAFGEALRLNPDFAYPHRNLGWMSLDAGDFAAAESHFERAVRAKHDYVNAFTGLARSRMKLGKHPEAEAAFRKAIEYDPDNAARRHDLAGHLKSLKQYDRAATLYVELVADRPKVLEFPLAKVGFFGARAMVAWVVKGNAKDREAKLRQARDWLAAELAAWEKRLPTDKPGVKAEMERWLADADLSPTRLPLALVVVPKDDQPAWKSLWDDVARVRDAAK